MRVGLRLVYLVFVLVVSAISADAQTRYKAISLEKDTLGSVSSRLSFSTNFIDWALFAPNIGVDIDLGNQNLIGGQSLFLNFKYIAKDNYAWIRNNNWAGRVEYRWHYRWNEHPSQRRGLTRPALWLENVVMGQQRLLEATARAMESSALHRPEMIKGRSYVGLFGEYWNFDGWSGGLTAGYEFPAFYHNRHFWQFHVGGNVGIKAKKNNIFDTNAATPVVIANDKGIEPVAELRFGLTFRKVSISRKYWQPRSKKSRKTDIADNREMLALIDSITENYSTDTKLFLTVPKIKDDMTLKSVIGKKEVIKAIRKQTGMPLATANFVNDTIFPIKRLDDYRITYRFKTAVSQYDENDVETTDVTFRFRVDLEGRQEAEATKQSFVDAVQKYRKEKGIPVLYAKAKAKSQDRNEIDGYIPTSEVMTLFSRIWGKTISLQQFKGVSQRVGVGVIRPIDEKGINRRSRYVISMSFHPQVMLNYDTDPVVSQFEVQFRGEAMGLSMYNRINGHRLSFQRDWTGSDTFSPEITPKEIAEALKKDGINVSPDMIEIGAGQNQFRQRYSASVYLQAAYVANLTYVVNDRGGLEKETKDMKFKINPWMKLKKWPEVIIRGESQDPRGLDITHAKIIEAFRKASGYTFKEFQFVDFCMDDNYQLMEDGRYRAYARIQLHPEINSILKIPYYIRFAR